MIIIWNIFGQLFVLFKKEINVLRTQVVQEPRLKFCEKDEISPTLKKQKKNVSRIPVDKFSKLELQD